MVRHLFLIMVGVLFGASSGFAAFDGARVDLGKFKKTAATRFRQNFHSQRVDQILFQDAALSVKTPKAFDGAMLLALGPEIDLADADGAYLPAVRLKLANGLIDEIFVRADDTVLHIATPDSLRISFPMSASRDAVTELSEELSKVLDPDQFEIEVLKTFKRVMIDLKEPSVPAFLNLVRTISPLLKPEHRLYFNGENYRAPFNFGQVQKLPHSGSADLDQLRDIVPTYVDGGQHFATEQSVIPEELKAQ